MPNPLCEAKKCMDRSLEQYKNLSNEEKDEFLRREYKKSEDPLKKPLDEVKPTKEYSWNKKAEEIGGPSGTKGIDFIFDLCRIDSRTLNDEIVFHPDDLRMVAEELVELRRKLERLIGLGHDPPLPKYGETSEWGKYEEQKRDLHFQIVRTEIVLHVIAKMLTS